MKSILDNYTDEVFNNLAIQVGVKAADTLCTLENMVHYFLENISPEEAAKELVIQVVEI
jgi:hypothetical protein